MDASGSVYGSYSGNVLPSQLHLDGANGPYFVSFVSNSAITAAGWSATVYNVPCIYLLSMTVALMFAATICSGNVVINDVSGDFTDGSGDKKYLNGMACSWTIAPGVGEFILVEIKAFNVQYSENCDKDCLTIHAGASSTNPAVASFSGAYIPPPVFVLGDTVTVAWNTDSSVVSDGFELIFVTYNLPTGMRLPPFCSVGVILDRCLQ